MTRLLFAVTAVALVAGCGGESAEMRARGEFRAYETAQLERGTAELELNRAFRALAGAAIGRDQAGVLAAVARGREAVAAIDRAFDAQLEAASGLAAYEPTRADAGRLGNALRKSRDGLRLIERQLDIGLRDPFLDAELNESEVNRLARAMRELSVPAAFARRQAARSIARTLDLEPAFDSMFDSPAQTRPSG